VKQSSRARTASGKFNRKIRPDILIFDVDGVLVDVRETYWRSAVETIRRLTGKRVTHAELHHWKGQPGNNDDWQMVANWATALGRPTSYAEARDAFGEFYWGSDGKPGNVSREKIIVKAAQIAHWAERFELNLFTGRNRREFEYTFAKWPGTRHFKTVITTDDVAKKKPHPDGLCTWAITLTTHWPRVMREFRSPRLFRRANIITASALRCFGNWGRLRCCRGLRR
jgi:phosphoglycolate phosphatase-like HAD superfamily hydrolase